MERFSYDPGAVGDAELGCLDQGVLGEKKVKGGRSAQNSIR